jgi:uncharacterized protein
MMANENDWDPNKAEKTMRDRSISFESASEIDWLTAQIFVDDRKDYKEERFTVRGFIGSRLHVMIYVIRLGRLRVISMRKANLRERRAYARETGRPL